MLGHKLVMRSHLLSDSFVQSNDDVSSSDGRKAVGDYDRSATFPGLGRRGGGVYGKYFSLGLF